MERWKGPLFAALVLVLTIAVLESSFYAAGRVLQRKWAMWRPPAPVEKQRDLGYEEYLRRRDPLLGWPRSEEFGKTYDVNGARFDPFFPDGPARGSCVSLYGDSFTGGGDESSRASNWGSLLSKRLGCYVANFGVGGYGTDQSYLRFLENDWDASPVVVLGVHTADALRNLTRIRDLENYARWWALKPRFVIDEAGRLELVPIPDLSEEEYARAVGLEGEPLVLEHESLQPGGPAGAIALEFPYTLAVVRNVLHFYGFRSRWLGRPQWMEFLQPGHPLKGLEIMVGIGAEFVRLASGRGKASLLLVLPHLEDLEYQEAHGRVSYQALLDEIGRRSLPVGDVGPRMLREAGRRGVPVKDFFGPTGHYNDAGNEIVADLVLEQLSAGGLRPGDRA